MSQYLYGFFFLGFLSPLSFEPGRFLSRDLSLDLERLFLSLSLERDLDFFSLGDRDRLRSLLRDLFLFRSRGFSTLIS